MRSSRHVINFILARHYLADFDYLCHMNIKQASSRSEEILNTSTHAVGLLMGIVVCRFFVVKSADYASSLGILSLVIYFVGVASSYAASTMYHAIPAARVKEKALARKVDHAAIYWHIAGSYTPVTLIAMREGGAPVWGIAICSFVWLAALVGTALSFRKLKAQSYLETACYVLMGLTPMIIFRCFLLNGGIGLLFGWLYRKYGLRYAMIAHGGCHVISKLIWMLLI